MEILWLAPGSQGCILQGGPIQNGFFGSNCTAITGREALLVLDFAGCGTSTKKEYVAPAHQQLSESLCPH